MPHRHTSTPNLVPGIIIVSSLVTAPIVTFLLWRNVPGVMDEGHIVEWAQAILLLLAAFIHGYRGRHLNRSERSIALYHITLALLCLTLFAREVDVDQLGPQGFWPAIEVIFRSVIVLLWVLHGIVLAFNRRHLWLDRARLLLDPGSRFVFAGILLYGVSWVFDKEIFPIATETALYFEETLQLVATLCFFFGALFFWRQTGTSRSSNPGTPFRFRNR